MTQQISEVAKAAAKEVAQLTPEQQQAQELKEMEEFLASEENRQNALSLAAQIRDTVGNKWFSLDDLVRKSSETRMTAYQKIKLIGMFNLLVTRMGDSNDDRKYLREPLFKVTISLEDQIEGMQRIVDYHNEQAAKFDLQIKSLREALAKSIVEQKEREEAERKAAEAQLEEKKAQGEQKQAE